ncbi:MAG TPA: hypothetical protein VG675_23070 [Bryobacteraceae bacterium]|nr:hypothetical protein [Bryobacteraceae bacterium]
MKRLMVLTLMAMAAFMATAKTTHNSKVDNPIPTCNPCDWAR